MAFIAWRTWQGWPHLPLDVSANDADTRAAFNLARQNQMMNAAILTIVGLLVLFAATALIRRILSSSSRVPMADGQVWTGPRRILLMRHAEKTGDPDDIHLSKQGDKRAKKLATYIPETFGIPDYIFAAARSKRSIRSIETMQPLAAAIGKPVKFNVEDKQFSDLVDHLMSDAEYRGALVIVCWHHGKLPGIAKALGAPPGTYPDPWRDDVFDLIVDLDFRRGMPPSVSQIIEPF
jgi:phosphohistidine phosphatase SixA